MKIKSLIIIGCIIIITLTGCGEKEIIIEQTTEIEEVKEPIQTFDLLEETKQITLTDKKIQIADALIEFPIKVNDFIDQTGFDFSPYIGSNSTADTVLAPNETGTVYMTTDNYNILMVEVTNTLQVERKLSNCYVTGVDISQTNDYKTNLHQANVIYTIGGITYGNNIEDIRNILSTIDSEKAVETVRDTNTILHYAKEDCYLTICYDTETGNINEIKYNITN